MEHWSKSSSMKPLPLGRRQMKRDLDVSDSDQKVQKVFPVVQVPHGKFMRPIDAARCITHQGMINTKISKIQVDHVDSPKFLRNMISTLRNGITSAKDFHIHSQTKCSLRVNPHVSAADKENEARKFKKNLIHKNSKPPGVNPCTRNVDHQVMARKKVKEILHHFRYFSDHLFKTERRADLAAAKMIKEKFCYPDKPFFGSIPGVEIGDKFVYRMEIHVLGLHRPPQGGIDWMFDGRRTIAISIVASGGYDNRMSNHETLIYSGQGGNAYGNGNQGLGEDQKLKKGNLALMNSIKAKNPVRVIRGKKVCSNSTTYFYDGLYTVEKMWQDRSLRGKRIFKFKLMKIPGQKSQDKSVIQEN